MIKEALKTIDKKELKNSLLNIGSWTPGAIDAAFSRGVIPAAMAPDMEKFTSISAKFWQWPETYNKNGDRR